ncbi:MAG: hypothetical protein CMA45_03905 [Euryarchaeota archaeon]|nr:hypothetical protein [Euryarchaeota archaeon]|tara:strand:- start:1145 stop:1399 length:255 start_codon:yes stop_codon:yes gene_type:complete
MMEWRPKGYLFDTKNLVRALFDEGTDEGKLLVSAAAGNVEIFSKPQSWNGVLWLIMNTLVKDGKPIYNGQELRELKESLPIVWR